MKISLEWVADYVDLPKDLAAKQLAHDLTLKTVEVEDWIDTGAGLAHIVVARIKSVKPLGAKGHQQVMCDIGARQPVTVVGRAANLAKGGTVAVALPGAFLISASGGNPREVVAAEVLGVQSRGIICAAADLGLQKLFPTSQSGEALDLSELDAKPGAALADALGLNDVVLEIDNKSLTNRPDLWGHYGIARELAAIYGRDLKPLPTVTLPPHIEGLVGELEPAFCRRLAVVEFSVDNSALAPLWLRSRLARIGEGTVNLAVDISNYVMFTVGQPTHVYDADRISLPLSVSRSEAAAKLDVLTGESRELDLSVPVIRDASGPVAVAGIMGGASSAVTSSSTRFVLEAATFAPQPVRRASQRLALRTEASARFEKGLDTPRVDEAVNLFLDVLTQVAPDTSVTGMQDVDLEPTESAQIDVNLEFLTTRIGQSLDIDDVARTLQSLGFTVAISDKLLHITVPTWRSTGDVSLPHDIVEEVARIHGYDNIPVAQLSVPLIPVRQLNRRSLDRIMREQLATRAGMQEVVTYPWVGDNQLAAAGLSKADTLRFQGAPAPDHNSLRPSLVPNLLDAVGANLRYGQAFRLFEVGTVYRAGQLRPYHDTFEPLPDQRLMIAAAIVGADGATLFRKAKGILEMLQRTSHLSDLGFVQDADAPWADQTVRLGVVADGVVVGALGLLSTRSRRLAGIEGGTHVACFELDLGRLSTHRSRDNRYEQIPELPEADFDLSVVIAESVTWSSIRSAISADVNELIHHAAFVDEFRGSWVPEDHKSLTLRVTLRPRASTLTTDDIAGARRDTIAALEHSVAAHLRE